MGDLTENTKHTHKTKQATFETCDENILKK